MAIINKKSKPLTFEERIAQTDKAREHAVALAGHAADLLASAAIAQSSVYTDLDNEIGRLLSLQSEVDDKEYGNSHLSRSLSAAIAN